ncbi:hypothetical protein [Parabacteroides johnsonii]|uniref:hypothetical protein n=1 Tax=Parabacteroides johnsonii TaxID=387661 RepID=UPI00242D6270|nr:hypothetical protein [Parabacteroides johnsonii]
MILTIDDLLKFTEEQANPLRGKRCSFNIRDGSKAEGVIDRLLLASTAPHLPCGFILSDGKTINFQSLIDMEIF